MPAGSDTPQEKVQQSTRTTARHILWSIRSRQVYLPGYQVPQNNFLGYRTPWYQIRIIVIRSQSVSYVGYVCQCIYVYVDMYLHARGHESHAPGRVSACTWPGRQVCICVEVAYTHVHMGGQLCACGLVSMYIVHLAENTAPVCVHVHRWMSLTSVAPSVLCDQFNSSYTVSSVPEPY